MKNKTILLALFVAIIIGIQNHDRKDDKVSTLKLLNIEALAQLENGCDTCHLHNYGSEAKTVSCKLDLGGGWFTSSVQRDCVPVADASKICTPVQCGGNF